jgi:hypothetical protein
MKKIFVFGSNLAGRHGAGSAREAYLNWKAEYGVGSGRTGNAYAIPTKDKFLNVLKIDEIKNHVENFIVYANSKPDLEFVVVKVGCGLAGFKENEMKKLFKNCPENCVLPIGWRTKEEGEIDYV